MLIDMFYNKRYDLILGTNAIPYHLRIGLLFLERLQT